MSGFGGEADMMQTRSNVRSWPRCINYPRLTVKGCICENLLLDSKSLESFGNYQNAKSHAYTECEAGVPRCFQHRTER
jgi:hypothetical protein